MSETLPEQTLDISAVLDNATDEQLQNADTFEEFLAQQQVEVKEPEEKENQQQTESQTEPESNPEPEKTDKTEKVEGTTEGETTEQELSDAEFRALVTATFRANHENHSNDKISKVSDEGMWESSRCSSSKP